MKKFIVGVLVGVAITAASSAFADEGLEKIEAYLRPSLPVTLYGSPLILESPPVMVDGNTYLKLRDVAAATGLDVNWNDTTQTVELTKGLATVPEVPQTTPVTEQPVITVNPRISEITKELEEWNGKLDYVNKEISFQVQVVSDLEEKSTSQDPIVSRDAKGWINFQKTRLDGMKENKQLAESEITKLQDELKTLQK